MHPPAASEVTTQPEHVRLGNEPAAAPADGRGCPKYPKLDGNGEPRGSGGQTGSVATAIDTSFHRFNLCG